MSDEKELKENQVEMFENKKPDRESKKFEKLSTLMEQVAELSEEEEMTCTIYRLDEDSNKKFYLKCYRNRVLPHEFIQNKYGGGTFICYYQFSARAKEANPELANTSFTVRIEGQPKHISEGSGGDSGTAVVSGSGAAIPGLDPVVGMMLQTQVDAAAKSERTLLAMLDNQTKMFMAAMAGGSMGKQDNSGIDFMRMMEINDKKNSEMTQNLIRIMEMKHEQEMDDLENEEPESMVEVIIDKVLQLIEPLVEGITSGEIDVGQYIQELRGSDDLSMMQKAQVMTLQNAIKDPAKKAAILDAIEQVKGRTLREAIEKTLT